MTTRPTVRASNGMVAAGHHLATSAGLAILREGGSAVDAAVAATAVCTVVLPGACSIGGDLFAIIYDASSREVSAYNGSGAAPAALDIARFGAEFPQSGPSLATVPGVVAAWGDLVEDHGRLGLERDLASAIAYADDGFPVSDALARAFRELWPKLERDVECLRVYAPRGNRPDAGAVLRQPELAASLRAVASAGAAAFYRGQLAEGIAAGIAAIGGVMTADDLAAHRTDRLRPLEVAYGGLRVFGQPPVSQGHVLLEELAIAEGLDLGSLPPGGAELVHRMVEIKKLAFADRDAFAGDPRAVDFDAWRLLEPDFVAARREAIGARASEHAEAGLFSVPANTTYLAVVDRDGNAASVILSVMHGFGAGVIVPGTGILLNDRASGFSLRAGSPNALAGGKRPVHTLNAVIALDGATPRLVFGTPGLHAQVQTNFQLAVSLIEHGLAPQEAIELPRWYHESGRALQTEARFPAETQRALAALGHEIVALDEWSGRTGGAHVIAIDPSGVLSGGADPRREGQAAGY